MESLVLKDLFKEIYQDDLTLAYAGKFSDSMTDKIIDMAEIYIKSHEQISKLRKRTSFLVAECFQNVVRHGEKNLDSSQISMGKESFLIRFFRNKCFIASENTMPNDQVDMLRKKLDEVNKYDREELKALYKKSLEEGDLSEKGGAGLGLIEMARKTGNKLHYSFMSLDENRSAFYLMLVLEQEDDGESVSDYSAELIQIEGMMKALHISNQFLLYHGNFSHDIISPVIEMIENNIDSQEGPFATKIKLYHTAIESMQNISRLSLTENEKNVGTLSLGETDQGFVINTLTPVNKATKEILEQFLMELSNTPPKETEEKFKSRLKSGYETDIDVTVPGFIALSRIAKSWKYTFETPEGFPQQFFYEIFI